MAEAQEEKRATRRFALRLPLSVNYSEETPQQKAAQTRDVSARGICFYVDSSVEAGAAIEFTLTLPPEITLTESIQVRCKGKVVRVDSTGGENKVAVAAVIATNTNFSPSPKIEGSYPFGLIPRLSRPSPTFSARGSGGIVSLLARFASEE